MLKRVVALAAGALALMGMQAPPAPAVPPPRFEVALWRLDCGDFQINDYNAFFSDTSEYPGVPKHVVGSCYLIKHGDEYMLWDTGMPADMIGHPQTNRVMTVSLRVSIVDQLARIGIRPEQISIVGLSHYHFDHTGQAGLFPNARLVMGAADLAALRSNEPGIERAPLAHWLTGGGPITEARGDHQVFGDSSVVMLAMPGHTPGHMALLVRLRTGPVLLSGDTYHFTEQVERRGVPPFNTSRAESLASMDRFDRLANNLHARVIIQHEPADVAKLRAFPAAAR